MAIDQSAVASVTGIETKFEDLRGDSILFLPQHLLVLAQGATDTVYTEDTFKPTSAKDVGDRVGYGTPAHNIARMLFPADGDGIGTITVTFRPLLDPVGGVAAVGDITPSGSQTKAAAYRVDVNNILSEAFVIPVGASVTAVCALIGAAIEAVLEMPVKVSYTYGTVTETADPGNTGDGTLTALSVTGTPLPGDWTLVCTAAAADAGLFDLIDPNGVVQATGLDLTGSPVVFDEAGIGFTLTDGTADFIVGDFFTITVPATDVQLTAKWEGVTGNDIDISVVGDALGTSFAITQPVGGLLNPDLTAPLTGLSKSTWYTMVLNALDIADTVALDALETEGVARWDELVRKPFVAFTGNTIAGVTPATAVSSVRRTDQVNAQLVSPGSRDLPHIVAARQLARIAKVANNNPPTSYQKQRATGLTPGDDADQWDPTQRDQAVKAGSSTVEVTDGVVSIGDVVTFYRPTGEPNPAYRYVVHIVRLQNIIFNIDLIFAAQEWAAAPFVPDADPTVNPLTKKPMMAKAAANATIDDLAKWSILSDPKTAKKATSAVINSGNPNRLDLGLVLQLSGNTNIKAVQLKFGFFFGQQEAA